MGQFVALFTPFRLNFSIPCIFRHLRPLQDAEAQKGPSIAVPLGRRDAGWQLAPPRGNWHPWGRNRGPEKPGSQRREVGETRTKMVMNLKSRRTWKILGIVIISGAVLHYFNPLGRLLGYLIPWMSPIELYGRVEDQHGKPIAGAKVELFPQDNPFGGPSRSKTILTSDGNGEFSIKGLHGISMGVLASKEGFIHLSPLGGPASSERVDYADGAPAGKRYSNPRTPLILRLQDPGEVEQLVCVREKGWRLAINGKPRQIALDSEDGKGPHQIEFRLWSNTLDRNKPGANVYDAFDWTFEACIPGGGFIWSDSNLDFEAPEGGYKETIRFHYPASLPREKWKRFRTGRYFVKFRDNTFGRIIIDVDAGTEPEYGPLSMQSWFNPKPGSHNLASEIPGSQFHGGDPEKEP